MKQLKGIIFDFDGVIVESVGVKIEAFRKLFEGYPEDLEEIIRYHMATGGISRYFKFEHIFKEILNEHLSAEKSKELGEKFTEYGYGGVVTSPFVKGAENFLEKYHKQLNFFIASGTPHEEMLSIVHDRKLKKFFKSVYGSPATKGGIARMIITEHKFLNSEVIFVGDSINDYEGAQEVGIKFIGRIHKEYANPFSHLDVPVIRDLDELESVL